MKIIKLFFRQWLALKCRKPIVVVIGARRTGKSYTAIQLAKKSIAKGDSVCILSPTTALARDIFNSTVNSGLKPNYFVDKSNHAITNCKTKAKIKFKAGSDLDLLFPPYEKLPDVFIINETFSPISTLLQINNLQNKINWKYKKIFIAYTPLRFISKKIFKDLYGNKIKVYVWKQDKRKIVLVGRRCGKTGLVHHTIIESLPVSDEKKKKLHELYEKALRGEE